LKNTRDIYIFRKKHNGEKEMLNGDVIKDGGPPIKINPTLELEPEQL